MTRESCVVVRPKADERPVNSDGDGIPDAGEASLGTDPLKPDTDGDGLSDYEEVVTHKADPLRRDTDGDSLSDKFEVDHGLDPNSGSSDGTHRDDEVKVSQTLPESAMSRQLRDESNVVQPTISDKVAGELASSIHLSIAGDAAVRDNRAVIGKAVQVVGDDSHVSGLTLSFDLSRYEGDATYLIIATLDESGGFVPVDFEHTGSTLSATLTKGGTYFVLDVKWFLDSLGIMPDKEGVAPASLSARHPEDEGDGSSNDGNANAITIERGEKRSSEGAAPERLMVKRERPRSRGVLSVQARPVQG